MKSIRPYKLPPIGVIGVAALPIGSRLVSIGYLHGGIALYAESHDQIHLEQHFDVLVVRESEPYPDNMDLIGTIIDPNQPICSPGGQLFVVGRVHG